jgi:hypothetical protein
VPWRKLEAKLLQASFTVRGVIAIDKMAWTANLGVADRETTAMSPALVLATVNAPYSKQLDANELANCLKDPAAATAVPGHMSSFFGEVDPASQVAFASLFGISESEVVAAAKAFAAYSGETYALAP